MNFSPRVPVFDANVRVGDRQNEVSPFRTREQLLAEMDRHGVDRSLIYHAHSEDISPVNGNILLENWLSDDGRTYPLWSALPTSDSIEQLQSLHIDGRVNCVRLVDTCAVGLPFRPWSYGSLLSWLSENGIPLWISLTFIDPDDIVSTISDYPDLVTVLLGAHYQHALWVRPLLRALPNSHLELSRLEPIGEVDALRNEFGAERLIYGSWYPNLALGPVLHYLHHTSLSDEELTMVCGGNLERILKIGPE